MGYSSWSTDAYRTVRTGRDTASGREIFRDQASVHPLMDPRHLTVREARDSEHHPNSVPIIVAFDVTASMGYIPTDFAKVQLGRLMTQLVEQGWVRDPQVLFAAVGDAVSDRGPLQIGQFESGLEMDQWLTRIWLEGRGGDIPESYTLVHWFATHRTATDAWEKRGKRGYLFTIGDAPNKELRPSHIARVFGGGPGERTSNPEVLADVDERWSCFHIVVADGGKVRPDAWEDWSGLLGRRALACTRPSAICEVIGTLLALSEGELGVSEVRDVLADVGLPAAEIDGVIGAVG